MQIQRKELINELLPALAKIGEMQNGGLVILPAKVSYALAKNYQMLLSMDKAFEKFKFEQLELHVNKTEDGRKFATVGEGKEMEWHFKEGSKETYGKAMSAYLDEEVTYTPYKVNVDEIKVIPNFPINILPVIEQFEIVTELQIPVIKKVLN